MFRPTTLRSVARSVNAASQPALRVQGSALRPQVRSQLCTLSRRPQAVAFTKPLALQLMRAASDSRGPVDKIDTAAEKAIGQKHLKSDPSVSTTSSTHPIMGEVGLQESGERETEMLAGVKQDMVC